MIIGRTVVENAKNATQNLEDYKLQKDKKWKNLKVTLTKYKHLFFWSCYQIKKFFSSIQNNLANKFHYGERRFPASFGKLKISCHKRFVEFRIHRLGVRWRCGWVTQMK